MNELDNQPEALRELALFAGAGGGILGGKLLGWRTVCAVEYDEHARSVLVARQNDGILDPFPIWDDVCTFDGKPWRGIVDVISGGFPCQDISAAGKGAGITGERSGLWKEMARIIDEVRPRYCIVENSPMLTSRGLGTVLGDLATLGYDAKWGVLGAADVGAPHQRDRIWIVANARQEYGASWNATGMEADKKVWSYSTIHDKSSGTGQNVSNTYQAQLERSSASIGIQEKHADTGNICWWETEPGMDRMANGMACQMDRLERIGNGQVPGVVALAWKILS